MDALDTSPLEPGSAGGGIGQSWAGGQDWNSTSTACYPLRPAD